MAPQPAAGRGLLPARYAFCTVAELQEALRTGACTSLQLAELFLDRIRRLDGPGGFNAVVNRRPEEEVLAEARAADAARAAGKVRGPLHGLPFTAKDSFDFVGLASTWGSPAFADAALERPFPVQNAVSLQRLLDAGAILIGKTNTPPFLADWQSYNRVYGVTRNPWDPARSPGGSSGGSAAALAAGFTPFELGSDLAGSIRCPASFCGLFGHKSTFGTTSPEGHAAVPCLGVTDMAVHGPLARSAEDLDTVLRLVVAPHSLERRGLRIDLPAPRFTSLKGLRVACWTEQPGFDVADQVRAALERAVQALRDAGAEVSLTARPRVDIAAAFDLFHRLLRAVIGARLTPKLRAEKEALVRKLEQKAGRGGPCSPDPDAEEQLQYHRCFLQSHHSASRDQEARAQLRAELERCFTEDADVIVAPATPTTALLHDYPEDMVAHFTPKPGARKLTIDGKEVPYERSQLFWHMWANLGYLPSTAFPAGLDSDGLPVGLQVIGRAYEDRTTIAISGLLHAAMGLERAVPPGLEVDGHAKI